ncbi:NAD(P)-dependent oxidoreductase [Gemmatimonadota bacterium]
MRFLPVALDVQDRRCVVVGGGGVGTRKVQNLLRAGAAVTVVSPGATEEISSLARDGAILWVREKFREAHLGGAFLAVAATDDPELNGFVVSSAKEQGVLVCDASSSRRSQVIFGALHRGDGTTVAVFSDGEAPARARGTRDRIASFLDGGAVQEPEFRGTATHGGGSPSLLVLVAHGSRDPRWRASLEELTESVQASLGDEHVALAFMQFTGPSLGDIVGRAANGGVGRLRILPLFMASAGHVEKDIFPLVEELRARYPRVVMEVLTPVGEDPLFHRLVNDIATQTQE